MHALPDFLAIHTAALGVDEEGGNCICNGSDGDGCGEMVTMAAVAWQRQWLQPMGRLWWWPRQWRRAMAAIRATVAAMVVVKATDMAILSAFLVDKNASTLAPPAPKTVGPVISA